MIVLEKTLDKDSFSVMPTLSHNNCEHTQLAKLIGSAQQSEVASLTSYFTLK